MWGKKKEEPVNDEYTVVGGDIDKLIAQHKDVIAEIIKEHQTALDEANEKDLPHDEIFVLRYVLDCKGDKNEISKRIEAAIKWRKENNALIQSLELKADGGGWSIKSGDEAQQKDFDYCSANVCSGNLPDMGELGYPTTLVRTGFTNQSGCMKNVKHENITMFQTLQNEALYRLCDKKTREKMNLIRSVQIVDLSSFSLRAKTTDRKFFGVVGASQVAGEYLHPMILQRKMVVNPPMGMGMLKGLFGKKSKDVVDLSNNKKLLADEFVSANKGAASLPDFLGGSADTPEFFKGFKK